MIESGLVRELEQEQEQANEKLDHKVELIVDTDYIPYFYFILFYFQKCLISNVVAEKTTATFFEIVPADVAKTPAELER